MAKQPHKPARRAPGPEAETLKIDGNWVDAIDKALSKKRPVGGFPKLDRPVRPRREQPSSDPLANAEKRLWKTRGKRKDPAPTKDEVQAEMIRAHCTRSRAIANLKGRAKG